MQTMDEETNRLLRAQMVTVIIRMLRLSQEVKTLRYQMNAIPALVQGKPARAELTSQVLSNLERQMAQASQAVAELASQLAASLPDL